MAEISNTMSVRLKHSRLNHNKKALKKASLVITNWSKSPEKDFFFSEMHRLTELFLGLLKGLFKVGTGVGRGELEDEAALCRGCGELQLCGQESHTEGQGLFVRQLPVHRRHQVLNHLVQGLGDAQGEETEEINL